MVYYAYLDNDDVTYQSLVFLESSREEKRERRKSQYVQKLSKKDQLAETFKPILPKKILKWTYFDPGYSFFSLHHSCSFCWLTITDLENAKKLIK